MRIASWLSFFAVLFVAAVSTAVLQSASSYGLPGWAIALEGTLIALLATLASALVRRLTRARWPRPTPSARIVEGRPASVRGRASSDRPLRVPSVGVRCLAWRVRYLGPAQEILGGTQEVGDETFLGLGSDARVPLRGPVQVEWAEAKSVAVLRSDPAAASLGGFADDDVATAVLSWIEAGSPVVATGIAVRDAHASELSGYRGLEHGWRLVAPEGAAVVLHPMEGRLRRLAIGWGLCGLFCLLAAGTPLWVESILRTR